MLFLTNSSYEYSKFEIAPKLSIKKKFSYFTRKI